MAGTKSNLIEASLVIELQPGKVKYLKLKRPQIENPQLFCGEKMIPFFTDSQNDLIHAYLPESYFSELKPYDCFWKSTKEKDLRIATVHIKAFEYKREKLRVNPKTIQLSEKDLVRAQNEQKMLNQIYSQSENSYLFQSPFQPPMKSFITSHYGIKRVYNNMHKGQHLGTDFRAAIGDSVQAVNDGKVVFAGDLFYTGGTVIVDHGLYMFSVYGHLSKLFVQSGDRIKKGSIIAYSGNSGRTSGPHLHWGIKLLGQFIDGFSLIDESKIHFSGL